MIISSHDPTRNQTKITFLVCKNQIFLQNVGKVQNPVPVCCDSSAESNTGNTLIKEEPPNLNEENERTQYSRPKLDL